MPNKIRISALKIKVNFHPKYSFFSTLSLKESENNMGEVCGYLLLPKVSERLLYFLNYRIILHKINTINEGESYEHFRRTQFDYYLAAN